MANCFDYSWGLLRHYHCHQPSGRSWAYNGPWCCFWTVATGTNPYLYWWFRSVASAGSSRACHNCSRWPRPRGDVDLPPPQVIKHFSVFTKPRSDSGLLFMYCLAEQFNPGNRATDCTDCTDQEREGLSVPLCLKFSSACPKIRPWGRIDSIMWDRSLQTSSLNPPHDSVISAAAPLRWEICAICGQNLFRP